MRNNMDRYKEGYNDCNREWEKKIQEEIKGLKNEVIKWNKDKTRCGELIANQIYGKIMILQDLLKKG